METLLINITKAFPVLLLVLLTSCSASDEENSKRISEIMRLAGISIPNGFTNVHCTESDIIFRDDTERYYSMYRGDGAGTQGFTAMIQTNGGTVLEWDELTFSKLPVDQNVVRQAAWWALATNENHARFYLYTNTPRIHIELTGYVLTNSDEILISATISPREHP